MRALSSMVNSSYFYYSSSKDIRYTTNVKKSAEKFSTQLLFSTVYNCNIIEKVSTGIITFEISCCIHDNIVYVWATNVS